MPRWNAMNNAYGFLLESINDTATSFTFDGIASLPTPPFKLSIDDEIMEVGSTDLNTDTISSVVRGVEGTTAATHDLSARGSVRFTADMYLDIVDYVNINVETLSDDKTLTNNDVMYQFLNPDSTNRTITLPSDASVGKIFKIFNTQALTTGLETYLAVYYDSIKLDSIYNTNFQIYIFDGTNWIDGDRVNYVTVGYSDNHGTRLGQSAVGMDWGVGVGNESDGSYYGVGVGNLSDGSEGGAAVGNEANGSNSGTAVGAYSDGSYSGTALGKHASTNNQNYAIAKGYYSICERWNEETKSSDGAETTKYSYSTLAWHGSTTDAVQTEIFLGGVADKRATVLAQSAFGFSLYITALNDADGKAKRWKVEGLIKRDASDNTSLISTVTKTVIAQSDTGGVGTDTWDIVITANDTEEALKVEVLGEVSKNIKWICRGELEEVRN